MDKAVVNKFQPSISEWFALISENKEAGAFRLEDNGKVERLEYLYQKIGLPYERPEKLEAAELTKRSKRFNNILSKRGDELCAIRLVPKKEGLPKIRNRGLSIRNCYYDWYLKQKINPQNYFAYICPHIPNTTWSMIFVVSKNKIFGEIIRGGHAQLTQGTTTNQPINFQYDFKDWHWSTQNIDAQQIVKKTVKMIRVISTRTQKELKKDLKVKFNNNYLLGYFETVVWPNGQIHFIDYNRLLLRFIPEPSDLIKATKALLNGQIASGGRVEGRAKIIPPEKISKIKFRSGDILVCPNTDVRYLPFMKLAGGIITEQGGLLSHASIIARELQIPCLTSTKEATLKLKNNQIIILDANQGIVLPVDRLS